jgi:predicted secreted protein
LVIKNPIGGIIIFGKKIASIFVFLVFCAMISGVSAANVENHGIIYVKENQTFDIKLLDYGFCGYTPWKITPFNETTLKLVNVRTGVFFTPVHLIGYSGFDIFTFKATHIGNITLNFETNQLWNKYSVTRTKYTVVVT